MMIPIIPSRMKDPFSGINHNCKCGSAWRDAPTLDASGHASKIEILNEYIIYRLRKYKLLLCPSYPRIELKIVRVSRIRSMLHMSKKPDDYRNIFRKSINGYPNYSVNFVVVIIMLIVKPNDKFKKNLLNEFLLNWPLDQYMVEMTLVGAIDMV